MKKYINTIIGMLICWLVLPGCDKYLDVQPKGITLLTTSSDYDQWLNDPALTYGVAYPYCLLNYLGDNVDDPAITIPPTQVNDLIFTWASQYSVDLAASPQFWGFHYATINKFNTVLLGIDHATGGTSEQRNSLKAEALLGRAFEYFYLVNEYGKEYDSATAATDLAVPFVTSNDVSQIVPPRSTIGDIYKQIIADINAAIPSLPADNSANRFRGSVAAAYSVLARVYFYARDYVDAAKNASLALQNTKAVMLDLNGTFSAPALLSIQPDVIYGRQFIGEMYPDTGFMRTFDPGDLRVSTLYRNTDGHTYMTRGATFFFPAAVTRYFTYPNSGTTVQEMKLIEAECAVRSHDLTTALQQLDDIRKDRFVTAGYVPYQSNNADSVLQAVLTERSHELPFVGLRWFDMRRLDKENRMGAVRRYDLQGNVIATLAPHSAAYTLQIPVQVLKFNPGMTQNPQ